MEDIDEPKLSSGQCIVDVEWCGICGSDLHEYLRGKCFPVVDAPAYPSGPSQQADIPHVLTGQTLPVTMGHEICGRVRDPPIKSGLKDGDPVMVDPRIVCRSCEACTTNRSYGCLQQGYLGSHAGGGFAERCVVDSRMLHKLPDDCPLKYAAVIEPLAVVNHAIGMTGITDWKCKNILILGGGPIGLAMTIALKANGATNIIVSEPTLTRRKQLTNFVDHAIDPVKEDVANFCKSMTKNRGIDLVFDCAGVPAGLASGFQALKLEGMYVNVAVWEKPVSQCTLWNVEPLTPVFFRYR